MKNKVIDLRILIPSIHDSPGGVNFVVNTPEDTIIIEAYDVDKKISIVCKIKDFLELTEFIRRGIELTK